MSNSKMLIDATHPEETRVVVQRNGKVEEFDFESAARKLLRGNIYLAKVTRVEPSLQAAFVDYGGNRHGFLAFNEIHPDYYQIPVADRQALIEEEAAAEAELEAAADRRAEALARRSGGGSRHREEDGQSRTAQHDDAAAEEPAGEDDLSNIVDVEEDEHIEEVGGEAGDHDAPQTFAAATRADDRLSEPMPAVARDVFDPRGHDEHDHNQHDAHAEHDDDAEHNAEGDAHHGEHDASAAHGPGAEHDHGHDDEHEHDEHSHEQPETDGHGEHADDAEPAARGSSYRGRDGGGSERGQGDEGSRRIAEGMEDMQPRTRRRPRSYKIQEVIKRRQVILVQIVKEERGNKGAALTTYLSLAGRYTVLMPNTARGGGISRKITNPQDRKRLKAIAQELEVPEGMGLIIRTAGAARTKQEIKRDFEYLLRLWESVRDLTLQSTAPSLVYEEGDLIKRSIRDLYNKDVEEVVVAGEASFHEAHDFMRMLMPSHAKNVINYKDPTPLFTRYGTERQLNAMFSPQVTLRSGGYIVINQTEALVAIDVNSGKSTREFSIEETALATNLEASEEIARQLKLRDLAGLIVIDFIDMEEKRNNRSVERRLKDALRHARARIQLGRISHFGLMEMSRQRLRTGVLEGSTTQCPHCQGTGIIRSTESIALAVLRGLEDAITAGAQTSLVATTTPTVALYILNSKRAYVTDMEVRHGYTVTILGSERIQGANFTIERGAATATPLRRPERAAVNMDWGFDGEEEDAGAPEGGGGEIVMVPDPDDEDEALGSHSEHDGGPRGEANGDDPRRGGGNKRRRRRRGGRRERGDEDTRPGQQAGASAEPREAEEGENFADEPQHGGQHGGGASANLSDIEDDDAADGEAGDAPEADAGADGDRGEKRGRRRRRGRRGGRRGRGDRDGAPTPESFAANDANGSPENPNAVPSAPGFEPQPEIDVAVQNFNGVVPDRQSRQPSRPERTRHERIWDRPTDAAPRYVKPEEVAEPIKHAEPPAPVERVERLEPVEQIQHVEAAAHVSEPEMPHVPARPRHETGSSEPRVERVVLKPDHTQEGSAETAQVPQRKGWWQRRFSGE